MDDFYKTQKFRISESQNFKNKKTQKDFSEFLFSEVLNFLVSEFHLVSFLNLVINATAANKIPAMKPPTIPSAPRPSLKPRR